MVWKNLKYFVWHSLLTYILEDFKDGACFKEESARILSESQNGLGDLTVDICRHQCFIEKGFAFAGVQNGNECWCGNDDPPVANLLPDSACNRACRGDNTQMCGAGWKNNVYKKSGKMCTIHGYIYITENVIIFFPIINQCLQK